MSSTGLAIIDEQNFQHIKYGGDWIKGGQIAQFNETATGSQKKSSTMTVSFTGTSLSLYGTIAPGAEASYNVSIDGGLKNDRFTVNRDGWVDHTLFWSIDDLDDKEHSIMFQVGEDNDIPIIIADYLTYKTSSETPMDDVVLFVDSEDVTVQYAGDWERLSANHYMMSETSRRSTAEGDSFTFEFEGVGVSLHGQIDHDNTTRVKPIITLDDKDQTVTVPSHNESDPDPWWNQEYFSASSLEYGRHTLVVTAGNDQPVWLDYILVTPGASASGGTSTSTPSDDDGAEGGSGLSAGGIAGAVVGAVGGLAVLILALFFWYRRSKRSISGQEEQGLQKTPIFAEPGAGSTVGSGIEPFLAQSPSSAYQPRVAPPIAAAVAHPGELHKGQYPAAPASSAPSGSVSGRQPGPAASASEPEDANDAPYEDSGVRLGNGTRPPPLYTAD